MCLEAGIKMTSTEKGSPWQNRTEVEIRELKKHIRQLMDRTNTPGEFWDFCVKYVVELRNRLARPLSRLNGRTPQELITGNTPDISELIEFEWFQPIWYFKPCEFPHQNKLVAHWIGIANHVGQALCYWILPKSGIPIARMTIQEITKEELDTKVVRKKVNELDLSITEKIMNQETEGVSIMLYREDKDENENDELQPLMPDAQATNIDDIETKFMMNYYLQNLCS